MPASIARRRPIFAIASLLALSGLFAGCATTRAQSVPAGLTEIRLPAPQIGVASYYASRFHGRLTANGERYDEREMTAAHRTLPFGTRVRVTRVEGGESVVLRINDRGPHRRGRVLDLSLAAARALRVVGEGLANVRIEVLGEDSAAR